MATADFGELLQAAEQLTAEFDPSLATADLPRVERNLHQLVEAGQQLHSKTARDISGLGSQDVKASIFLGSKGVDLPSISQKLDHLVTASKSLAGFEPVEPLRDTDVAGFLRNERENAILSVIEETRNETFNSVERRMWDASINEWESEKRRILNSFGEEKGFDLSQSVILRPETSRAHDSTLGIRSELGGIEIIYADQVCKYNEAVTKGGIKPDLFKNFSALFPEERDSDGALLWSMAMKMSELSPVSKVGDAISARVSARMSTKIIATSRSYLEKAFEKYIRATVFSNLNQAQLGGKPGTYHLVKSFLNVKKCPDIALEDGVVSGMPVWPMIYYCLRCGDLAAAVSVASEAGPGLAEMTQLLSEVASSADYRLSPQAENVVRIAYKRSIRSSTDPFKRAVYCVLAACEPADQHAEVSTSLDDYLWIKLTQVREEESAGVPEALTLAKLQHMLAVEYGETYFHAFEQPVLYFQALFLTGQFEAAIEFLFRTDQYRAHGVHIALAMNEAGLLLLPNNSQSALLSGAGPSAPTMVKCLNLARLVLLYVRKFESTDPKEALHYFYFLRHMSGLDGGSNLFVSCVEELVLESRQFDLLLGQMLPNGTRTQGLIDKFNDQGSFQAQQVIEIVAENLENKGMFEDSVKLYDLAGKQEKVVHLLIKLLAQVVSQPMLAESKRDRLHRMAVTIAKRYRTSGHSASSDTVASFYLLLDLMTFFDLFHASKLDEALSVMTKIRILPFSQNEVDVMVSTFRLLTNEVRRYIPDILLASMNILLSQYKKGKEGGSGPVQDGGKQKYLESLRDKAKALITFAGMIPYRLPGDTNARLVQMEVMMN